jgi:hypothetical protein
VGSGAELVRFALECAAPQREEAVLALVATGSREVVKVCGRLFRDDDGLAGRLLARLTDGATPTADALIDDLRTGGVPGVPWIIAAHAVAEHGAVAVPALVAALKSFPLPARETDQWMRDESAKYHLMRALAEIGPAAAAAVPVLTAISRDEDAYRDTRWIAERTLEAIDQSSAT